ncbi:hypothetical protein EJ08DRAFT_495297 [Tothia fuscella]|uniref:Uncharacterized protein n=1 Tax=Tothia fuscella TaxID=1048955 RepID=A0A9P4NZZ4_9PEZI|nr:hypothetical protein EJ08DRAFT_495297 [Tothia fuscella]
MDNGHAINEERVAGGKPEVEEEPDVNQNWRMDDEPMVPNPSRTNSLNSIEPDDSQSVNSFMAGPDNMQNDAPFPNMFDLDSLDDFGPTDLPPRMRHRDFGIGGPESLLGPPMIPRRRRQHSHENRSGKVEIHGQVNVCSEGRFVQVFEAGSINWSGGSSKGKIKEVLGRKRRRNRWEENMEAGKEVIDQNEKRVLELHQMLIRKEKRLDEREQLLMGQKEIEEEIPHGMFSSLWACIVQ